MCYLDYRSGNKLVIRRGNLFVCCDKVVIEVD